MDKLPTKGDLIAAKYLVENMLGSGGMGAVFEVSHRVTGKRFAIKWLLPALAVQADAVGRFMREAQVAGRVDHPNVVEVYDFGQDGDSFYIVMELLHGEPLARRLERLGRLPADAACRILIPVARGLHAAHAAGVIHRDLKPDNIFLCNEHDHEEQPKVVDFGISKMSALAGEAGTNVTRTGVVMGTPRYMAPEQIRGEAVDPRTDVYALGVLLYEMIGGSVPFPGDTYSDLVLRIMTEQPPSLATLAPGTPKAIIDIVGKAMARDREQRFATVQEFALALEPFDPGTHFAVQSIRPQSAAPRSGQARISQAPTPLATESERIDVHARPNAVRARSRRVVAGALAAAFVALLVGGSAYVRSGRSAQHALDTTGPVHQPAPMTQVPAPVRAAHEPTDLNAGDLPVLNTTRIAPEAPQVHLEPARAIAEPADAATSAAVPARDVVRAQPRAARTTVEDATAERHRKPSAKPAKQAKSVVPAVPRTVRLSQNEF